jgi:hypothetical protein
MLVLYRGDISLGRNQKQIPFPPQRASALAGDPGCGNDKQKEQVTARVGRAGDQRGERGPPRVGRASSVSCLDTG